MRKVGIASPFVERVQPRRHDSIHGPMGSQKRRYHRLLRFTVDSEYVNQYGVAIGEAYDHTMTGAGIQGSFRVMVIARATPKNRAEARESQRSCTQATYAMTTILHLHRGSGERSSIGAGRLAYPPGKEYTPSIGHVPADGIAKVCSPT